MTALCGETIPILPARDVDEAVDFYSRLGFELLRRYDEHGPTYLILRQDEVELHVVHHPGTDPHQSDVACYLRLADAGGVHGRWRQAGVPGLGELRDTPWGMREFGLVDPSGNLLRVGTRLGG